MLRCRLLPLSSLIHRTTTYNLFQPTLQSHYTSSLSLLLPFSFSDTLPLVSRFLVFEVIHFSSSALDNSISVQVQMVCITLPDSPARMALLFLVVTDGGRTSEESETDSGGTHLDVLCSSTVAVRSESVSSWSGTVGKQYSRVDCLLASVLLVDVDIVTLLTDSARDPVTQIAWFVQLDIVPDSLEQLHKLGTLAWGCLDVSDQDELGLLELDW